MLDDGVVHRAAAGAVVVVDVVVVIDHRCLSGGSPRLVDGDDAGVLVEPGGKATVGSEPAVRSRSLTHTGDRPSWLKKSVASPYWEMPADSPHAPYGFVS